MSARKKSRQLCVPPKPPTFLLTLFLRFPLLDLVGRQDVIESPDLCVRIVSDQGTCLQAAGPDAVFKREEDQSSVRFGGDSQFHLVHSGQVVSQSDFCVRLQVVYKSSAPVGNHASFKFIASCDVSVRDLVAAAAVGKADRGLGASTPRALFPPFLPPFPIHRPSPPLSNYINSPCSPPGPEEDGTGTLRVALLQRSLGGLPSSASTGPALALLNKIFLVCEVRASASLIESYGVGLGDESLDGSIFTA